MSAWRFAVLSAACVVAASLVACATEEAEAVREDKGAVVGESIANDEHPEVVHLSISGKKSQWTCTGTIVGRRTILTARHCVDGAVDVGGACEGVATVDTLHRGAPSGTKYAFDRCATPELGRVAYWSNDFAFIRLANPVSGVTPARLAEERPTTEQFTVYGYGSHGEGTLLGDCAKDPDGSKRKLRYRGPLGLSLGQATCPGDSGGPHFVGESNIVAGVTSGGALGVDANAITFAYREELAAQIAAFEE